MATLEGHDEQPHGAGRREAVDRLRIDREPCQHPGREFGCGVGRVPLEPGGRDQRLQAQPTRNDGVAGLAGEQQLAGVDASAATIAATSSSTAKSSAVWALRHRNRALRRHSATTTAMPHTAAMSCSAADTMSGTSNSPGSVACASETPVSTGSADCVLVASDPERSSFHGKVGDRSASGTSPAVATVTSSTVRIAPHAKATNRLRSIPER